MSVVWFVSCSALAVEAWSGTLSLFPPDDDVGKLVVSGLRSGTQSMVTPDDDVEELVISGLRSGLS